MTIDKDKTPEPKADKSDADVLNDALDGKPVEDTKVATDDQPKDGKPEGEKVDDVPDQKKRQYKNYGDALKGALHWEKTAGKKADELQKKDGAIDALNARLADLERQLSESKRSEPKPDDKSDDGNDDDDNPILKIIDSRLEKKLDAKLKPLESEEAKRKARAYRASMESKWGESWEGMQSDRDSLVAEWKSGKLLEPELWQYATVGRMFLNRQITTDDIPRDDKPGGPIDGRSAAKPGDIKKPGQGETDEDVISGALNSLTRRPMGTAPVH